MQVEPTPQQPQPTAPQAPQPQKGGVLAGIIALVVIVGGGIGALYAFGEKEGESCKDSAWGCAPGLLCVSNRCRKRCSEDSECAKGKSCNRLIVIGGKNKDQRACY
jgi:hypothetical protein